ncbi:immunoglobulin superfamily member 11 isoform X4 [Mustela lutreola]|uniref:immunoglobulin superfamily member 11 isoform X3 n=1 Tax=Mustela putorius furo TaxID=9669 RepID=UPI001D1A05C9|nr:immunoglobulin superfamily member 11 isoform X3 [Mustela putorius furo]XP_059019997.1 immunoglobulin superfamily member 11 isoform X4 [Mustela lutreola]
MTSPGSPLAPLLLLSLHGVAASLEVSESPGSIQVARGQTAVLPCTFTTSAALINLNVIWMVIPLSNANQPEQVILYQGGQMFDGAPRFHGRVGFTGTMPATNVSIFINNTQLSDTGTYQCLVNNLPDRGGRNIGVTGLTVLVPPSAPHCQIQGSQDIGSDVILLCSSEEGIPRPTYLWEKLDNTLKLPPTATQGPGDSHHSEHQCPVFRPVPVRGFKCHRNQHLSVRSPGYFTEDDLPPKCSSSAKAFHTEISSSENNTLTSSNTYNSRYWSNNPKVPRNTESFNHFSDLRQSFSLHSGNANIPSIYANGTHLGSAPHKTLVVTANRGSSPQVMPRSNGSVSRKPRPQHTHSYTVSQATLERIGAIPVMVPAQSRAGSLV